MIRQISSLKTIKTDVKWYLPSIGIAFLFLHSLILTLSPAVLYRSWQVNLLWTHWLGYILWLAGFLWFLRICWAQERISNSLLIPLIGVLCGWGILSIWRINTIFGLRQALWFLVCVFAASHAMKRPRLLADAKKYKYLLLSIGLSLAALTFVFGTYPGGAGPKLWLGFRGIYFQPSELLKLLLIFYLSAYFSENKIPRLNFFNSILPALVLFFSALALLLAQRDLGTSLIFIVIFILMLFIKYKKRRVLLFGLLFLLLATIFGYTSIDLVRIRFNSWILPWLDARAGSYQIIQSIIAIAAGGITGSGIGLGSPRSIPIAHSDFIYSAIVEETGLFGGIAILLLFALFFTRGLKIAIHSKNSYHQYLAAGIATWLTAQAILIIGGNIRLLPITGVTLPFLSYGGSSLLISFISVCVLLLIENDEGGQTAHDLLGSKTTNLLSISFLGALVLLSLATGWWSFFRSRDLQLRADNPRHFISARYIKRGSILDRNDRVIAQSSGETGRLHREIAYPPLSNTVGFSNSNYGNAGLEARLDDYLSGERGYPAFDIWFNYLLFDQPLPGRDIRLTIDLKIQSLVDELMANHAGSAIVMNAQTGEILAIASHPYFNANELKTNLEKWRYEENSPLLNRATQGAYPLGNLAAPFLLTKTGLMEAQPGSGYLDFISKHHLDGCAVDPITPGSLPALMTSGCDSATLLVTHTLGNGDFTEALDEFFVSLPADLGLPGNPTSPLPADTSVYEQLYGQNLLRVSPLQVAVAASSISGQGVLPSPKITAAVNVANEGWVVLSQSQGQRAAEVEISTRLNYFLHSEIISGWETTAVSHDEAGTYAWYMAGTPDSWPGAPLAIVLVLEDDEPEFARQIGREIYNRTTQ